MSESKKISKEIFQKQKELIQVKHEVDKNKIIYEDSLKKKNKVEQELLELINLSVDSNREFLLSQQPHYKFNHKLDARLENYYDDCWFRKIYGKRHVYDSYGRHLEYEGPDVMVYAGCEECDKYYYREGYRNEIKNVEERGKEIFDDNLMRLEKEGTYELLTS